MDDEFRSELRAKIANVGSPRGVTPIETEVLSLAALGWTNQRIASERGVSIETIKTELASGFQKLGVHRRAELLPVIMRLAPPRK